MQDNRDGQMKELDVEKMARNAANDSVDFKTRIKNLMKDPKFVQKAGEDIGIPFHAQGPVFSVDEIVEVKGGQFRVRGFNGGLLHLEGIPSKTADLPSLMSTYKFRINPKSPYVYLTVPDTRNEHCAIHHGISIETARRLQLELNTILGETK
jgi:hypothetical protein